MTWCRVVVAVVVLAALARTQRWSELQGRTQSGVVALEQAVVDATSDALVLLVASHPDDRYVLPAVYLRYRFGSRVAVLLASRGGGGQNSLGPETGDALERIRTLETEAGCLEFGGTAYYLDRPDRGFRRTAAETFAEWGREATLAKLVSLLRDIRPDVVVSTHSAEETHGHDLALAELLPEAVARAADPDLGGGMPHRARALFLGATSTPSPLGVSLAADDFEPVRGDTLRWLGYETLLRNHLSPGPPSPPETLFERETVFVPMLYGATPPRTLLDGLPTLFDDGVFPGSPDEAAALRAELVGLAALRLSPARLVEGAAVAIRQLEALRCRVDSDAERRRNRRLEAARRVLLHANAIQVQVEARPGVVAVPGEELDLHLRMHVGGPLPVDRVGVLALRGEATIESLDRADTSIPAGGSLHAALIHRVPLIANVEEEQAQRFHRDRFVPPVQFEFTIETAGVAVPVNVVVPVDLRPAVDLSVVPRILLLPTGADQVRFTVQAERNSNFPVDRDLDVRCPAGYRVDGPRMRVTLDPIRRDIFEFTLTAPTSRRPGVDVVRIGLGGARIQLPVHKVDVAIDRHLRIGVVRSMDDALSSVIGAGGFGLQWSGLSDIDLAVGDLQSFDTIVVDVRALRDRPEARRSFRRLLEFAHLRNRRLIVFYHKDSEFEPPGEGFLGAPFQPFQIGRARVTRADAPVQLLRPDHVLLRQPNSLQAGDWDGWEQERALYLPAVYSETYEELIELHDPGLPPERSALLYARCGEGEYVYCALALWRQIKKLHPGSIRLLANLLTPAAPRD